MIAAHQPDHSGGGSGCRRDSTAAGSGKLAGVFFDVDVQRVGDGKGFHELFFGSPDKTCGFRYRQDAVDAMGGDNAPQAIVEGVNQALAEFKDIEIQLYGDEAKIKNYLIANERVSIVHTDEKINSDDEPVKAIRKKKKASMVLGAQAVKEMTGQKTVRAKEESEKKKEAQKAAKSTAEPQKAKSLYYKAFPVICTHPKSCSFTLHNRSKADFLVHLSSRDKNKTAYRVRQTGANQRPPR